ncbi:hypothetical protein LUZ60_012969 [Juncus effusus]|nr:hypothetical protein LUZ60_012969 [Juncus effusus]
MGQGVSCSRSSGEHDFYSAVQNGDLQSVESALLAEPDLIHRTTIYDRLSALHIAAANGCIEVLSMLLDRSVQPDLVNRHKQTPLMLAAMHGKLDCVEKLLEAGANILMFDSLNRRTCLHYASYYGHSDCVQLILSVAQSTSVAESWGFARFVNVRDDNGATPLHLASRQGRRNSIHILLENGGIISATTSSYGFPGSTPLHLAARGGNLDCIRELLAWGADRLQRDSAGRIAYEVALKRGHGASAALLNPSSAEPLVWPSPLKFIAELDPDAKALLEAALMEANREREKKILKGTKFSLPCSPLRSEDDGNCYDDSISEESDGELCSICFDQPCTIEVKNCGHEMCASCILALCCHSKPNPTTPLSLPSPTCPFCRCTITKLVVATPKAAEFDGEDDLGDKLGLSKMRKLRRSRNFGGSEGTSGFKDILGKFLGKKNEEFDEIMDKV